MAEAMSSNGIKEGFDSLIPYQLKRRKTVRKAKLRFSFNFDLDVEVSEDWYEEGTRPEDWLKIELENFKDDPFSYLQFVELEPTSSKIAKIWNE